MARVSRLTTAINRRFPVEESPDLAVILSFACDREIVSYQEIDLLPLLKDELLMILHQERLLISTTSPSNGGSAWKDKLLTLEAYERYQMPRAVRHLVEEAEKTGEWDPRLAEEKCLREVGERSLAGLLRFLSTLKMRASDFMVTPQTMQETAATVGIDLDLHRIIDELVRCGIISTNTQTSLRLGLAQYEMNRSLCWGKQWDGDAHWPEIT
ncbi:hypothetical protein ACFLX5_01215 [Chloroflexota bacterium]